MDQVGTLPRAGAPHARHLAGAGSGVSSRFAPPVERPARAPHRARRHRSIFISDVHLGTRGCKAELLADFLAHNDCRTLYLVGDIVDFWQLQKNWYWSAAQTGVLRAILQKLEEGTRVIYVPGNHDEVFRDYCGLLLGGVELQRDAVHETADGRLFLVTHGDRFDGIVTYARWLALAGDRAYLAALRLNDVLNLVRRRLRLPYWSLSAYLKQQVKRATRFISDFEHALACEARLRGFHGIVAGHIHHAETRTIGDVLYCNGGDWVESCSALVEDGRGQLQILRWTRLACEQDWAGERDLRPEEAPAHVPSRPALA
jgi:UDP-2,3-diacylglucosamine pyrophosphatase LpxH